MVINKCYLHSKILNEFDDILVFIFYIVILFSSSTIFNFTNVTVYLIEYAKRMKSSVIEIEESNLLSVPIALGKELH